MGIGLSKSSVPRRCPASRWLRCSCISPGVSHPAAVPPWRCCDALAEALGDSSLRALSSNHRPADDVCQSPAPLCTGCKSAAASPSRGRALSICISPSFMQGFWFRVQGFGLQGACRALGLIFLVLGLHFRVYYFSRRLVFKEVPGFLTIAVCAELLITITHQEWHGPAWKLNPKP